MCLGCVQLELILTAATLCVAIVGVISGLFGMNLQNTHEGSYTTFLLVRWPINLPSSAPVKLPFQEGFPSSEPSMVGQCNSAAKAVCCRLRGFDCSGLCSDETHQVVR